MCGDATTITAGGIASAWTEAIGTAPRAGVAADERLLHLSEGLRGS